MLKLLLLRSQQFGALFVCIILLFTSCHLLFLAHLTAAAVFAVSKIKVWLHECFLLLDVLSPHLDHVGYLFTGNSCCCCCCFFSGSSWGTMIGEIPPQDFTRPLPLTSLSLDYWARQPWTWLFRASRWSRVLAVFLFSLHLNSSDWRATSWRSTGDATVLLRAVRLGVSAEVSWWLKVKRGHKVMNEKKFCLLQMRIWLKIKKPVEEMVTMGRDINMDVVLLADLLASLVSKLQ